MPTKAAAAAMVKNAGLKLSVRATRTLNKLGPTAAPRKLKNIVPLVAMATLF